MIKVLTVTVTFVAIAIVTLFALTPQASAQTPTIDNDDYIVEGYDVTVEVTRSAGVELVITVTGDGDLQGTITDSTGQTQSHVLVSGTRKVFRSTFTNAGLGKVEIFAGPIRIAFQETVWVEQPLSANCTLPNTRNTANECVVLPKVAAAPTILPPVFIGAPFTFPIGIGENNLRVGSILNFFSATGATDYSLSGINATLFTITNGGDVVFNVAPDFETPRGGSAGNLNIYTFRVTASNSAGSVHEDVTVLVANVIELPSAITLTTGAITANTIVINWVVVPNTKAPLTNYEVKYNVVDDTTITTKVVDSGATAYMITGLIPDTQYKISVVSNTAESSIDSKNFLTETTLESDPTGITLSVTPTTVMESSQMQRIQAVISFTGGKFYVPRLVRLEIQDGTATETTDYVMVPHLDILFSSEVISLTRQFDLSAIVDSIAEPSGETVNVTATLLNADGSETRDTALPVATATITLLDDDFSSLDFGGDDKVTSNDGLILYLVASGVNASALAIFVDGPGTTSEKIDRLTALENRLETDMTLDLGGDENVTSNDGLILYLVASGVNASALAIFVDGPGTTSAKIDRLAALQTRIDAENTGS